MDSLWVPAVNALGCHGRWAFLELEDPHEMHGDFDARIAATLEELASEERAREAARFLAATGGTMPDAEYIPRRRSPEAG